MNVNVEKWVNALSDDVEDWEREQLLDSLSLDDAFSHELSYGTGGVRALMGIGPNRLNRLTVGQISAGLAEHLYNLEERSGEPLVVIAYDTRVHSKQFAYVTACVLAARHVRVMVFPKYQPTPVLSFAIRHLEADAGVVITASHNAMAYNGYKVYDGMGGQATNQWTESIQSYMRTIDPFAVDSIDFDYGLQEGLISWCDDGVVQAYLHNVLLQSTETDCSNVLVSYSPLHGTGLFAVSTVLNARNIAFSTVDEQSVPDGTFPTCPRPNPEVRDAMRMVMDDAIKRSSDIAVATDPDADRVGVAARDENGRMQLLTGDEVGLLLFDYLCQTLPKRVSLVAATTIVSSPLFDAIASHYGIELRRTLTGFKYIGEQINYLEVQHRVTDFFFGAEESCGYLRGSYVRDKDGVVALLLVCEMTAWNKRMGRSLFDALHAIYQRYGYMVSRQVSVEQSIGARNERNSQRVLSDLRESQPKAMGGVPVAGIVDYALGAPMPGDATQVLPRADVLEFQLDCQCKVLIRPSGTEPKIKAYCFASADSLNAASARLDAIAECVQQLLTP